VFSLQEMEFLLLKIVIEAFKNYWTIEISVGFLKIEWRAIFKGHFYCSFILIVIEVL